MDNITVYTSKHPCFVVLARMQDMYIFVSQKIWTYEKLSPVYVSFGKFGLL